MSDTPETTRGADDILRNVNMEIRVSVGHAYPSVATLMNLGPDSILTLEQTVNDPVELFVGNKLIARGHLEEIDDAGTPRLAVRVTAMGDPMAGLK